MPPSVFYLTTTHMEPRKPTKQEIEELLAYLHETFILNTCEDVENMREELTEKGYIAVFDNYSTDYPGYEGKLLVIIATYDVGGTSEFYIWKDGKIQRVYADE